MARDVFRHILKDPDLARFIVRERIDIIPVLRTLAAKRAPIRLRFDDRPEQQPATLVSVKPEYEELVFDAAGLPDLERLDGSQRLEADTTLESVQVVFNATCVEALPGRAAFRARLPDSIGRVQRRAQMRYAVPSLNPPVCYVRLRQAKHVAQALRIVDLSLGGIALAVEDPSLPLAGDDLLYDCRIELPGVGEVQADLEVKHLQPMTSNGWRRAGCRFFNGLPVLTMQHVHRYASKLAREWRAGFDRKIDRRTVDRRSKGAMEVREIG